MRSFGKISFIHKAINDELLLNTYRKVEHAAVSAQTRIHR